MPGPRPSGAKAAGGRLPAQVGVALAALLLAFAAIDSVYDLRADQEALVVRLGQPVTVLNTPGAADAGLGLKAPLIERLVRFDRRTQDVQAEPIAATTADGRPILIDAFLLYRIVQPLQTYRTVGDARGAADRLKQMLDASVHQAAAQTSYAALVGGASDGDAAMRQVRAAVSSNAEREGLGVQIVDVGASRLDPTPTEVQAMVHRMQSAKTAEAAAIRAAGEQQKQQLMAQADKDAAVIRATAIGQSEAIWGQADAGRADIFAKAYGRDPSFAHFYQAMRAYEGALGEKQTTLILSPTSAFFEAFQKGPAGR